MTALDDLCTIPFHDADSAQRARVLSRLADTELSVALLDDPVGDVVRLQIFDLSGARAALAFDSEDRLAGFFGGMTPYAAMPGRVLAATLRADGCSLLINPGYPSEMLLDAESFEWLGKALEVAPEAVTERLRLTAPRAEVVEALAGPLAERLGDMRGMLAGAALAGTDGQGAGHVLLIAGVAVDRQPAIAKALTETLTFLPEVKGGVDIAFSDVAVPETALRFDLSTPPSAPRRPAGPPILR